MKKLLSVICLSFLSVVPITLYSQELSSEPAQVALTPDEIKKIEELVKKGKDAEGRAAYGQALIYYNDAQKLARFAPSYAYLWVFKGDCQLKVGDFEKALGNYQNFLETKPSNQKQIDYTIAQIDKINSLLPKVDPKAAPVDPQEKSPLKLKGERLALSFTPEPLRVGPTQIIVKNPVTATVFGVSAISFGVGGVGLLALSAGASLDAAQQSTIEEGENPPGPNEIKKLNNRALIYEGSSYMSIAAAMTSAAVYFVIKREQAKKQSSMSGEVGSTQP